MLLCGYLFKNSNLLITPDINTKLLRVKQQMFLLSYAPKSGNLAYLHGVKHFIIISELTYCKLFIISLYTMLWFMN